MIRAVDRALWEGQLTPEALRRAIYFSPGSMRKLPGPQNGLILIWVGRKVRCGRCRALGPGAFPQACSSSMSPSACLSALTGQFSS